MGDRKTPPQGGAFTPEEEVTRVTCLACGGEYRTLKHTGTGYRMMACRWCLAGSMSAAQVQAWRDRSKA